MYTSQAVVRADVRMPVTEILLLRHGHRLAWMLDPTTGKYSSTHPYPTRLPADPPLASHGVDQAVITGRYLASQLKQLAEERRLKVYSSLFYRCFQTLQPFIEQLNDALPSDVAVKVRGERGVGEWFGRAWFQQPVPADAEQLKSFFPWIDVRYKSRVIPDRHGENITALCDRINQALTTIVNDVEQEYEEQGRAKDNVTILICGHAAQIIASGRELTGEHPEDPDTEDFKCFTCGISKFVRRGQITGTSDGGAMGQWMCVLNSDCSHLPNGEERGWHFHGDESFDSYEASQNRGLIVADSTVPAIANGNCKL